MTGVQFLVTLSGDSAGHLAFALRRHLHYARSVGLAVPDELRELERACSASATGGQPKTELGSVMTGLNDQPMDALAVTYTSAAQVLSVSKRTVARMVADGRLKCVTVGGRPRIPLAELERLTTAA